MRRIGSYAYVLKCKQNHADLVKSFLENACADPILANGPAASGLYDVADLLDSTAQTSTANHA